ncbi:MAG: hypothetical protein NTX98_01065, partial [Candidatus Doudnabacteria bacterium]|nr:hypothetical protein [Candidatus Doudnabacteria bacterium]
TTTMPTGTTTFNPTALAPNRPSLLRMIGFSSSLPHDVPVSNAVPTAEKATLAQYSLDDPGFGAAGRSWAKTLTEDRARTTAKIVARVMLRISVSFLEFPALGRVLHSAERLLQKLFHIFSPLLGGGCSAKGETGWVNERVIAKDAYQNVKSQLAPYRGLRLVPGVRILKIRDFTPLNNSDTSELPLSGI